MREVYERRNLKAIAARWDARADSWDYALSDPACHLNEDDAYGRFIREVQRLVATRKQFCAANGVIDAGCGTGLVLANVCHAFAWGVGVDISPGMIQVAREKRVAKAKFLAGDCFDLTSLCARAGVVLSRGVLLSHYGRDQAQALLSAARAALVPGGFLVFDFLNEASRTKYQHAPENKTWFTGEEIKAIARQAGFSKASIIGAAARRVRILEAETQG